MHPPYATNLYKRTRNSSCGRWGLFQKSKAFTKMLWERFLLFCGCVGSNLSTTLTMERVGSLKTPQLRAYLVCAETGGINLVRRRGITMHFGSLHRRRAKRIFTKFHGLWKHQEFQIRQRWTESGNCAVVFAADPSWNGEEENAQLSQFHQRRGYLQYFTAQKSSQGPKIRLLQRMLVGSSL
jgi:hypothetical protein